MKKTLAVLFCLAAWLAGVVNATNPIETYAGPVRVLVISQAAAFGAEHVTRPFNGLSMVRGGVPYQPEGGKWFRLTRQDGSVFDEAESNRTILRKDHVGRDGSVITPWRMFPPEAIEPLAAVAIGDRVRVHSRRTSTSADGTVTALNASDWTLATDYPAESGDSGSLVTTPDGVAIGFISGAIGVPSSGSLVSVPPISPTWNRGTVVAGQPDRTPTVTAPENVPVIVSSAPPPVLPVISVEEAYQKGLADGKRQALGALQVDLEALLRRVKSAL